jgi:hypothetical protein
MLSEVPMHDSNACFSPLTPTRPLHHFTRFFFSSITILITIMTFIQPIDVDMTIESELTELTMLTSTDPSDDPPEIRALTQAADDTAFDLAFQRLPTKARVKINGIYYVRFAAIQNGGLYYLALSFY